MAEPLIYDVLCEPHLAARYEAECIRAACSWWLRDWRGALGAWLFGGLYAPVPVEPWLP